MTETTPQAHRPQGVQRGTRPARGSLALLAAANKDDHSARRRSRPRWRARKARPRAGCWHGAMASAIRSPTTPPTGI